MLRPYLRFYSFWVTLPNRCFPFAVSVEGKRIRGRAAYEAMLRRVQDVRGPGSYSYALIAYRQVFHVIGAFLFIAAAAFISNRLFGSEVALYVLLVSAGMVITVQEFYFHPRYYQQHLPKSVSDWLAWVVPIGMYLFLI
ncbi:MAG TPA: hypothetical protein VEA92_03590 [Candidatus Paceibacterota bacterium]|nr:hypothetical protein [Candidatus Paceibacterota bacterium]